MSKIHRIAGLKISRVEIPIDEREFWTPAESLPELEPAEDRLRKSRAHIFAADSISFSHGSAMEDVFEPKLREEHGNFSARATVYVVNMIVMVFAMPVGLALLFFNILCGENLRTTAHVLALTGLGLALSNTEGGARILSLI